MPLYRHGGLLQVGPDMNETKVSELPDIAERLRMYESAEWGTALRDIRDAADEIDRLRKHRNMLEQEILTFRERVAFLESPEVCAAAHDDVTECGYCQRDALRAVVTDWLKFAKDVQPGCAAGADWLEGLRKRSDAALAARGK